MKKVAIIQARMSSGRLPGKVLALIGKWPMLQYVVSRVLLSELVDDVIVATSTDRSDTPIVEFCKKNKIKYFRGSLNDVLGRYYECAKTHKISVVIRVSADCPLIDGELIDAGMMLFLKSKFDYLSNTINPTYPVGFNFEILTFSALSKAFKYAKELPEREHVTPYIWRNNSKKFKIGQLKNPLGDKSKYRITVDTKKDLMAVDVLINKFKADKKGYREIIKILERHPEIVSINKNVIQKKYGD